MFAPGSAELLLSSKIATALKPTAIASSISDAVRISATSATFDGPTAMSRKRATLET